MMGEDEPVEHCTLAESENLFEALAAAEIEHLDVDEHRTIVIYHQAILMVIVTEGQATAAQAFDVEFWKGPPNASSPDPGEFLTTFLEELIATTEVSRSVTHD
ncbi:hypothetical protein [Natronosalvus rutilus]|uniref:Uncharacterized protein n=1 Tax=Natronosalvus rutilus TaxID=2953753 RepID=A0A9E7SWV9_9EURY|nr:hypothetical protein [Natronosalvus rutilus]UTF55840.1 hypothetical protein NGM29_20370 [Natronosalvus rutilus]